MWWEYLAIIIVIFFGLPVGRSLRKSVPDEPRRWMKYLLFIRDFLFISAIAIAGYSRGWLWLQYLVPLIIILSFFKLWGYYEKAYLFMAPIIVLLTTKKLLPTNSSLLFIGLMLIGCTGGFGKHAVSKEKRLSRKVTKLHSHDISKKKTRSSARKKNR